MRLSFHGAAQEVTGACFRLEGGGRNVLVDCGLFLGADTEDPRNRAGFGFDPAALDAVLLTNAHLDRCGRLPLLIAGGFRGEIISTAATRELARLVLLDAAQMHESERRGGRRGGPRPLYGRALALETMARFARAAAVDVPIDLGLGWRATFHDAGHS